MSYLTDNFDDKIVSLLKNGAAGLMPSDTVYGLSARALDEAAIRRIYSLKGRDDNKPCIVLLADANQANQLGINPKDLTLVSTLWPAPITFIAPASAAPEFLHRGFQTLAVRVPDNGPLRKLLIQCGPLVSTSANLQGEEVAHLPSKAKEYFDDKLDFYIDVGELSGEPSTIVKAEDGQLKIIRPGAFKL
jgi:L-threonylcarbamoyladenylate synthase